VAATMLLAGCGGGQGVTVPPGAEQLKPCPHREIDVTDLGTVGKPGCDLAGSTLLFPDGKTVTIKEVGATFSEGTGTGAELIEYSAVNWGVPGVAATFEEPGKPLRVWYTSSEAGILQAELMR